MILQFYLSAKKQANFVLPEHVGPHTTYIMHT